MSTAAVAEAAMQYNAEGIVIHPLSSPTDTKQSPGKRPLKSGWQKMTKGMSEAEIAKYILKYQCNIGAVCGKASDLMVIDIDWYVKGIWEVILEGVDTSDWIKQSRTAGRWHWLFRFNPEFELKHAKPLGMDLLGEGGNVVMAPSVHVSGDIYTIEGDIALRPELPDEVITRIKGLLKLFDMLKTSLNKCRRTFKDFFKAVFEDDKDELYHDLSVFRSMEGRQRTLHLMAELKANGATDRELMLVCMLAFGDAYDEKQSEYEISQIKPIPAKTDTILADTILSQFHTGEPDPRPPTQNNDEEIPPYLKAGCYSIDIKKRNVTIDCGVVAEIIKKDNHIISYAGNAYAFDGAKYVEAQPIIDADIMKMVNEANDAGGKVLTIKRQAADIAYMIKNTDPLFDYPFGNIPDMIPCRNGIVKINFETGECELVPHSPEYKFNYCLPVDYNPECSGEAIHENLISKWVTDPQDIDILYQIPAQALLQSMASKQPYKKAYIIQGETHGGKSTYFELLYALLGQDRFACQSLQDIAADRFAVSGLEGKLINAYDDLTDVPLSSTGKFKTLTGAYHHDVEKKHVQKYSAIITAVHVFTCNAPPSFDKAVKRDTAFWERWEYVKFGSRFPINPMLCEDMFTDENMSGFLNRVISYMIRIAQQRSLLLKSTAADVREKWSLAADPIYEFIDANIEQGAGSMYVDKGDFLDCIIKWANAEGKDLDKIPNTEKGLTNAVDKYEIYPAKKTNEQGVQVRCYNVQCGIWSKDSRFTCKLIKSKTEQSGFMQQ